MSVEAKPASPLPALGEDKTFELPDMSKMLGDPSRLRIVIATLEGAVWVGGIGERLGLAISLVGRHRRLLRGARLVTADRRGQPILYRTHDPRVARVIDAVLARVKEEGE